MSESGSSKIRKPRLFDMPEYKNCEYKGRILLEPVPIQYMAKALNQRI